MSTKSNGNFARYVVELVRDRDLVAVAGAGVADDGELHRVVLERQPQLLRRQRRRRRRARSSRRRTSRRRIDFPRGYLMAFSMKSTIRSAPVSRRIRCLPTMRYSSSFGSFGRLISRFVGTVGSALPSGYLRVDLQRHRQRRIVFQDFLRVRAIVTLELGRQHLAEDGLNIRGEDVAGLRVRACAANRSGQADLGSLDFGRVRGLFQRRRAARRGLPQGDVPIDTRLEVLERSGALVDSWIADRGVGFRNSRRTASAALALE